MFNTVKDISLDAVGSLLALFYALPVVGGSYGVAIILLTATVMVVLMPLTIKATRSTIKMTQLQPQLRALQKEYKDDKAQLNQAMMAMYQENGVNPVGGCLPMLAQLPVFLILFNVLRGITRRVSDKPYFAVAEHARSLAGVEQTSIDTFDPDHLETTSKLYQDLSVSTEMKFGPFDLALDAWDVLQANFLRGIPYLLLIVFVVGSSYYQQRQISTRRGAVPDNPTPQQQTQQQLLKILPLMSGVWSFFFPAGLVLYWATSNLFRIGQQAYITQALYKDDPEDTGGKAVAAVAPDSSKAEGSAKTKPAGNSKTANGTTTDSELIGDGKPARNSGGKNKTGTNGSGKTDSVGSNGKAADANGSGAIDRNEAWARRRAQRTKAQASKKKSTSEGSSRTTPKGTKPPASKKKRKR